jgi:hypothetical protein
MKTLANMFYDEIDTKQTPNGITEETIVQVLDESFQEQILHHKIIDEPNHWELLIVFKDNSVMKITRNEQEYGFEEGHYVPRNMFN